MICGFDEINQFFIDSSKASSNSISFVITIIWILLMNVFIAFVCLHYFKTSWNIIELPTDLYTSEMYLEVKKSKRGRSYTFAFFIRRLAISSLVVFSVGRLSFTVIITLFSLIQFVNLNPYWEKKIISNKYNL